MPRRKKPRPALTPYRFLADSEHLAAVIDESGRIVRATANIAPNLKAKPANYSDDPYELNPPSHDHSPND